MENIFIVSLLLLMGASGFAIGALLGVVLARRYSPAA